MAQTPKYDLEEAKSLASDCDILFPNKSVNAVIAVFKDIIGSPKTTVEADDFIRDELAKLELKDFAERTLVFQNTVVADVYGKIINGQPWYIKFLIRIEDGETWLEELSFHPPDRPLKLQSGNIIDKGGLCYDETKKVWRMWE